MLNQFTLISSSNIFSQQVIFSFNRLVAIQSLWLELDTSREYRQYLIVTNVATNIAQVKSIVAGIGFSIYEFNGLPWKLFSPVFSRAELTITPISEFQYCFGGLFLSEGLFSFYIQLS